MHNPIKIKKFAVLLIALFITMYVTPFLPRTYANPTALTVSPNYGSPLGVIPMNGTIDTANGAYRIFFDAAIVTNGTANNVGKFTSSFHVPYAINGTHIITLQDVTANTNATVNFTVKTSYYVTPNNVPIQPGQYQEGATIEIVVKIRGGDALKTYQRNVTVTLPAPASSTYYNATLPLLTDENGTASNNLLYPRDFLPTTAHTNYTGTYRIRIYENATTVGDDDTFIVGLTNATTYHRLDWVNIKAMNYTKPNENATVTVKFGTKNLTSQKIPAVNGTVFFNWQVPANASMGSFKVTVANASSGGTIKPVADTQNFTVPGFPVNILTLNLNGEPVNNVNATVYEIDPYNSSKKAKVASGLTNSTGWRVNTLERGSYILKAFWKNVQVNETQVYVQSNSSWTLICQLARMEFMAKDDKTGLPMPRVYFMLNTNYVTVASQSRSEGEAYITNDTGKWLLSNMLVKANYTIRAYRTGLTYLPEILFNTISNITNSQGEKWFKINVTCPVLSLTVHAQDAKQAPIGNYPLEIYEYMGGSHEQATTDANSGNATFNCIVGRYQIRLYNPEKTIILSETLFNVTTENSFITLHSTIQHADLSVKIVDYLGQPVPNVKVKLERENTAPITVTTAGNGTALFSNIIGGNCMVSIYLDDAEPTETAAVYVENSTTTMVTLGRYVAVLGILVETTQFAVYITLIVLLALFAFFFLYRRRKQRAATEVPEEKKS